MSNYFINARVTFMKQNKNSLYDAITSIDNIEEAEKFLTDLCTPNEIKAFTERLEIAKLLYHDKLPYRDVADKIGASTTTVARVARFLHQEPHQGYKIILDRLNR